MGKAPEPCDCDTTAESSRRVCPSCGHVDVLAVPFSRSGQGVSACRNDGRPVPQLTKLSKRHFIDSRGYTFCAACGYVFDELTLKAPSPWPVSYQRPNHYARMLHDAVGSRYPHDRRSLNALLDADPKRGDAKRATLRRNSRVCDDAEILCGIVGLRGDAQSAVVAAAEAFYARDEVVRVRIEAVLCAIVAQVSERFGVVSDTRKGLAAFNVSNDQYASAQRNVSRWFETYWKGDKR